MGRVEAFIARKIWRVVRTRCVTSGPRRIPGGVFIYSPSRFRLSGGCGTGNWVQTVAPLFPGSRIIGGLVHENSSPPAAAAISQHVLSDAGVLQIYGGSLNITAPIQAPVLQCDLATFCLRARAALLSPIWLTGDWRPGRHTHLPPATGSRAAPCVPAEASTLG
ncbi:hypothetical protein NDU88_010636 [Pleurodeles waltl]|uniref:Uncharacterized protein n=1 Tax=Pleurodeles waltl TaxID=8319 RepID=A0AAV7QUX4_PLEWA|nr:hypothetical protein NDU88_010636 [Pleurodeles waltl]